MDQKREKTTQGVEARKLRAAVRELLLAHGSFDDERRPCGTPISRPHAWALLELLERGSMTISALATRLNIDRTNVSRLVARMEQLGELERTRHPEDGRVRLIRLTERGKRAAETLDAASASHFEGLLPDLGDASGVIEALKKLTDAMASRDTTM